jgi:hypothetical protein
MDKAAGLVYILLVHLRKKEAVGKNKCIKSNDAIKRYTV